MTSPFLRQTRFSTAGMSLSIGAIALLIAGAPASPLTICYLMFMVLSHCVWFSHNNVCDYNIDRNDPDKAHFPLVDGSLKLEPTRTLTQLALLFMACFYVCTTIQFAEHIPLPLVLFGLSFLSGYIYNTRYKHNLWAQPLYPAAYSLITISMYCSFHRCPSLELMTYATALWITLMTVGMVGSLKDLNTDPKNIARLDGTRIIHNHLHLSLRIRWFFMAAAFFFSAVCASMFKHDPPGENTPHLALFAGCMVLIIAASFSFDNEDAIHSRRRLIRIAAVLEAASFLMILISLYPRHPPWKLFTIYAIPVVWLLIGNRLTWGTLVEPNV